MKLSHLAIRISDPGRSLEFYHRLGFKKANETRVPKFQTTLIFLRAENGLELELVHNWNQQNPPALANGFLHLGLEVEGMEEFLKSLEEFGIKPVQPLFQTPEGMKICFLTDPDGYQIELVEHPSK